MLTNRKDVAKTSKNPGKTRTINHFEMITGDGTWYFVDLPGYGFANAPEEARRQWAEFTRDYLLNRSNLLSVMLLIDSTVKPQRLDLECLEFLGEHSIPVTVVFTKVDKKRKVSAGKRADPEENVEAFCREVSEYWDELPPMIFTSSKTGDGKQAVLNHIATLRQFFREGQKGKPRNKFLEDVAKMKDEGGDDDGDSPEVTTHLA
jgi:GTP-binding protein